MIKVTPQPNETDWMPISEAAALTAYSRAGINNLVERDCIPVYIHKKRYVRLSCVQQWANRPEWRRPKRGVEYRARQWIEEHRSEIEAAKHGDGKRFAERCHEATGIGIYSFYGVLEKCGIDLCQNHMQVARRFIRQHPYLAHEPPPKGWREFVRTTGVQIHSRSWRQIRHEYLAAIGAEEDKS